MNTQHTPGPWKAAGESIINEADTCCIAVIESDGGYEAPQEQREVNAYLIAAAPELLAACEAAMRGDAFNESHRSLCVAAISKAKGEA